LLKGIRREVHWLLQAKMQDSADNLRFEEAENYKQQFLALEYFAAKSEIVSFTITDVDVLTLVNDELKKNALINYIH
ncbi:UNVERIFIED_CONTAM: UvrB/UvrC motif-containing protein, partial [Prevotella sp. 15_C9]